MVACQIPVRARDVSQPMLDKIEVHSALMRFVSGAQSFVFLLYSTRGLRAQLKNIAIDGKDML